VSEYALYLDDSGHPADSPFVVVGGFIASENQWLAFEPQWKTVLTKYRIGPIFHMTDFERKHLKNSGKIRDELTDIINRHTRAHFTCAVPMEVYKRVNDERSLEETIGTPYSIAARVVAHNVDLWKKKHLHENDRILIFIEDGTKHKGDMEEAFRRDRLRVPQSVPKAHPCVQPGDFLAWEVFHFRTTGLRRRSFMKLLDGRDFVHGDVTEEKLIEACNLYKVPIRADMVANTTFAFYSTPKRKRTRTIQ
jgi:hypothetical protein